MKRELSLIVVLRGDEFLIGLMKRELFDIWTVIINYLLLSGKRIFDKEDYESERGK